MNGIHLHALVCAALDAHPGVAAHASLTPIQHDGFFVDVVGAGGGCWRLRVERVNPTRNPIADVIERGRVQLDPLGMRVRVDGGDWIPVDASERALLLFLVRRPGRVYSRAELLDRVFDVPPDDAVESRHGTVGDIVRRLRRKLEADPRDPQILRTTFGGSGGYYLDAGTSSHAAVAA